MSVQSQIDRLNTIKERIRANLVAQGITVPADTMLEAMAEQILSVAGEPGDDGVSPIITTTETVDVEDGNSGNRIRSGTRIDITDAEGEKSIQLWDGWDGEDGNEVVTTSGSGSTYTATVKSVKELTAGATFIMIPHTNSTTTAPTINVNGLGEKTIRQPLTTNTSATTAGASDNWLVANKPVKLMYDGTYWKTVEIPRPSASGLYGTVPITSGGTGATDAETARSNLGITPSNIGAAASSHNHSASEINSGTLNSDRLPTVSVAKGGTGATDAATARTNLEITPANIGAAESSHKHSASNINSGTLNSSRLPTVPITKGGTGATDAATARSNLGITPANIGAFATNSIITFYNVSLTVSGGVGTYSNSNIKSTSRCFVQRRVGSYMSGIQMVSGTTSNNGSVTVAFDTNFNSNVNINLIVINA